MVTRKCYFFAYIMLKFKKDYILGVFLICTALSRPTFNAYCQTSLRVPIKNPGRLEKEQVKLYLKRAVSIIGNQRSPLSFGLSLSSKEVDITSLLKTIENSSIFRDIYDKDWIKYITAVEKNTSSPAYIQIIDYMSPHHQTAVYRSKEQHRYLRKKIPELISKKIRARKGKEPVVIKVATLGGGLEPISLGTTIIETIKINYPEIELGKDIILDISDIQIDPRVIKNTIERISSLSDEEFSLKDTNWGLPEYISEEEKEHINDINRNIKQLKQMLDNGSLRFTQGSIVDYNLLAETLTRKPDLIFCNYVFYHLDTKHKVAFIDFLGQNASSDTTFIFCFHTASISMATEDYLELTGDRESAEKIIPEELDSYPPLFDKYFTVEALERPADMQYSKSYIMRKSLKGPFGIPGRKTGYSVNLAQNKTEMHAVLDKWYSKKHRNFDIGQWENDIDKHSDGKIIFLESDKGEILGLAFYHKADDYMFDMSEDGRYTDSAPVYFLDRMEVDENYRNRQLGEKIMARLFEETLNDSDIGQRVILTEPETKDSDRFFDRLGGNVHYVQKNNFTLYLSEEEKWKAHHRLFHRNSAEKLLSKIKKEILPEQLELQFGDTPEKRIKPGGTLNEKQLDLFETGEQPASSASTIEQISGSKGVFNQI